MSDADREAVYLAGADTVTVEGDFEDADGQSRRAALASSMLSADSTLDEADAALGRMGYARIGDWARDPDPAPEEPDTFRAPVRFDADGGQTIHTS